MFRAADSGQARNAGGSKKPDGDRATTGSILPPKAVEMCLLQSFPRAKAPMKPGEEDPKLPRLTLGQNGSFYPNFSVGVNSLLVYN